jgi:TRAP-type C4-dicarboxylate transport system substrate-binding protein
MQRTKTTRWATAATVLAVIAVTSACQGPDRAGGDADVEPTVLQFAQPIEGIPPDQLVAWAEQVGELTGGSLQIEFENGWRLGEADYESATIADVQAGKIDMAWVGARAFDRVDVTSFQALLAPLLVDSHDLQAKVFEEGIPQEMLAGLEQVDLVGVGVLPGPMRKVLGVEKAFTKPADFAGEVVGMQDSKVTELSFAALGATTKMLPSGADIDGVDAYEQQLSSIWGNHYELSAGFVTSNLNPWPRPLVLFIDKSVYDGLTDTHRQALTAATDDAMLRALDASRAEDDENVADLCKAGLDFVDASSDDLGSLERAWAPVYDELRMNRDTSEWIDRITALKASVNVGPDQAQCDEIAQQPAAGSELPDGTYEMTLIPDDIRAGCPAGQPGADALEPLTEFDEVLFEAVVEGDSIIQTEHHGGRGGEQEVGWAGSYRIFRDTLELDDGEDEPFAATWSFDGKQLVLSDMRTDFCDNRTVWTTHPWVLVTKAAEEPTLEGTWTTTLTESDWAGEPDGGPAGVFTLTFEDGLVTVTDPGGEPGYRANYRAFRDRIETSDADDVLTATYSVDGDTLTLSDIEIPGCTDCGPYVVVWGSHPWVRQ